VKRQNRSLEIVSKPGDFSVDISCLPTGRYRLVRQSIASHVVFEGDFWSEIAVEFSHIDGRPRFAKHSINDGKQVEIAAIDPDF